MKAVILVGKGHLEIRDAPEPSINRLDDVLVEAKASSICGTDLAIIDGVTPTKKLPMTIGHEAAGVVTEVAKDVTNVKVGDQVLVDPNVSDSTCYPCRMGLQHLCSNGGLMGRETDGAFSERLVLPSRRLYLLPSGIPSQVMPLIQPLSTAVHANSRIELFPDDSVLILGLGVMGLMLVQLAKLSGAHVLASSGASSRLELAKKLGADEVIDTTHGDFIATVMKMTENKGVDILIDAADHSELLEKVGLHVLRPRGTVVLFSTKPGKLNLNIVEAYFREATFKSTRSSQPVDFQQAIRLVKQRRIDLQYLVTKRFAFEEIEDAISFSRDRRNVLKVVVTR